ncbi:MAG: glutamate racemase [Sodalis sp. (in: enterobacteria)]
MATRLQDDGYSILSKSMVSDGSLIKRPSILIFDSGVGGLSIYDEVRQMLPNAYYLYVFDNEAFPYGEKAEHFIVDRVVAIISAMWRQDKIDLVIIACNTASTISLPALRMRFPCPIIGVVPAIKPAAKLTRNGILGLLATRATLQRSYIYNLISQYAGDCRILQLGMAELVDMTEAKLYGKLVSLPLLRKLFRSWLRTAEPPDTVILGCTHFPLLRKELQLVFPVGTRLIDSGSAIARRAAYLVEHDINLNSLQDESRPNKAYCINTTSKTVALMPALTHYGFGSLGILTL